MAKYAANARPEVGLVGLGHVGKLMQRLFPDALTYDKYSSCSNASRDDVAKCRFAFVCVSTSEGPSGAADLSEIYDVAEWLEPEVIVLRSTVPPGTSRRLVGLTGRPVVFWPEYCGEWSYITPKEYTPEGWPSVILGGDQKDTRKVIELLVSRLGPMKTYRQTTFEAAELCKYMENAWLAAQVIFAWQFRMLADSCGADYWEVRELWGLDPRVSKAHSATFQGSRGFAGKCLPKDLAAIASLGKAAGVNVSFLSAIAQFNEELQKTGLGGEI